MADTDPTNHPEEEFEAAKSRAFDTIARLLKMEHYSAQDRLDGIQSEIDIVAQRYGQTEPSTDAPPTQEACQCAQGSCFQPGTPGCVRENQRAQTAAEPGLIETLQPSIGADDGSYDAGFRSGLRWAQSLALPFEDRRLAAEALLHRVRIMTDIREPADLLDGLYRMRLDAQACGGALDENASSRARLETTEAALRAIASVSCASTSDTGCKAVAIAELALKPEEGEGS